MRVFLIYIRFPIFELYKDYIKKNGYDKRM